MTRSSRPARLALSCAVPLALLFACEVKVTDGSKPGDSGTVINGGDEDGDNFTPSEGDCDESDATVNPGAAEICDGLDNDCDDDIDEDLGSTFFRDADDDGFGDAAAQVEGCEQPAGYVGNDADCNDGNASMYPGNAEVCDGLDNDCDGVVDDGVTGIFYSDADEDGYGDAANATEACEQPEGYVTDNTDCDDTTRKAFPGNTEVCDKIDNNCNGRVDEGVTTTYYADVDGDAYGDASLPVEDCSLPMGYSTDDTDCDDSDEAVHPDATEYCNAIDDNCDGVVDEDSAADASTWYADADNDTYGDASASTVSCYVPLGYVSDNSDCDDTLNSVHPGAAEYCNGIDDDCDGETDEDSAVDASTWYLDADADTYGNSAVSDVACYQPSGYVSDSTDCNDGTDRAWPGADEYCDGIDNDCDGIIDEDDAVDATTWYADNDGDGYGDSATPDVECSVPAGYVADSTDCDDRRALTNPGATEYCNTHDDDCDGTADEESAADASTWYRDADSDGYGDAAYVDVECYQPSGYVADSTDCDDLDGGNYPGATEICDGEDNDCDGSIDEDGGVSDGTTYYADVDGDDYGDPNSTIVACGEPIGYADNYYDCNDGDAGEPVTVDVTGSASGDGSIGAPFDLIQDGIDAAYECVVVNAGTYDEYEINFNGKSLDLWGVEGSDATRIDPGLSTCNWTNPSDCHTVFWIGSGEAPTIHGFTVSGGTGYGTSSSASTTCSDSSPSHVGNQTCTVTTWEYHGGGAYIADSDPVFSDVVFDANVLPDFSQTATGSFSQTWIYSYGGGVYATNSLATFDEVVFLSNSADQGGGTWIGGSSSLEFLHGWWDDNAASDGAGMALDGGSASVTNSALACNNAVTDGGAFFMQGSGSSYFVNAVFYNNESGTSTSNGSAGYNGSGTTTSVLNSIADGSTSAPLFMSTGTATLTYSDVSNRSGSDYGGTVTASSVTSAGSLLSSVKCDANPWNDDVSLYGLGGVDEGDPDAAYNDADGTRNDLGMYGGPEGSW